MGSNYDEAPSTRLRNWCEDVYGILRLAITMYQKLRLNRHKEHWAIYGDFDFYIGRLRDDASRSRTPRHCC